MGGAGRVGGESGSVSGSGVQELMSAGERENGNVHNSHQGRKANVSASFHFDTFTA